MFIEQAAKLKKTTAGQQSLTNTLKLCCSLKKEIDTIITQQNQFYRNPKFILSLGIASCSILILMSVSLGHDSFQQESIATRSRRVGYGTLPWHIFAAKYEEETYTKVDEFILPNEADWAIVVVFLIMLFSLTLFVPETKDIIQHLEALIKDLEMLSKKDLALTMSDINELKTLLIEIKNSSNSVSLRKLGNKIENIRQALEPGNEEEAEVYLDIV